MSGLIRCLQRSIVVLNISVYLYPTSLRLPKPGVGNPQHHICVVLRTILPNQPIQLWRADFGGLGVRSGTHFAELRRRQPVADKTILRHPPQQPLRASCNQRLGTDR